MFLPSGNVNSRPDFVISPANQEAGYKSIAIFCDGLAFHACPDKPEGRIYDDIEKRKALIESGRYLVWSVTWKDVEDFQSRSKGRKFGGLFQTINNNQLGQLYQAFGSPLSRDCGRYGNFA